MQRLILFLVTLSLSIYASAASITDLNLAMKSTISPARQGAKNILYGGQDMLTAQAATT